MTHSLNPSASPCVAVCRLDERDVCTGCKRTLDEISRWGRMSDSERRRVLDSLPGRSVDS